MSQQSDTVKQAQNAFEEMRFAEEFIASIRAELSECLGLEGIEALPMYFRSPVAMPAKVGIAKNLVARFQISDEQAIKKLKLILSRYFQSDQYHAAMQNMSQRYSLDMEVRGTLSDDEKRHYRIKSKARAKKREEKELRRAQRKARLQE